MTDKREKLIELLKDADEFARYYREIEANGLVTKEDPYAIAADYLIANGVKVQEWIPVTEGLPDMFKPVLVCRSKEKDVWQVEQGYRDVNGWWKVYGTRTKNVTHWMPLPELPKENDDAEKKKT